MGNIMGKGDIAGNQHFLLSPQCFLLYQRQHQSFYSYLICRLQMLPIWIKVKCYRLVQGELKEW